MKRAISCWIVAFMLAVFVGVNEVKPLLLGMGFAEEHAKQLVSLFVWICAILALMVGMLFDSLEQKPLKHICNIYTESDDASSQKKAKDKEKST